MIHERIRVSESSQSSESPESGRDSLNGFIIHHPRRYLVSWHDGGLMKEETT